MNRPTLSPQATLVGIASLIVFAALSRLLPHPPMPWNFTPIESIALFGGATIASRQLAVLIPLAAMALSDLFLGWHGMLPVVYGLIALFALAGRYLAERRTLPWIAAFGFTSALVFFLVTNGLVWLNSGMYPMSAAGLAECYIAGLPFFGNQLAGVAVYSTILFGAHALWLQQRAPTGVVA